jgi:hypothetical protein
VALTFWNPAWLMVADRDWIFALAHLPGHRRAGAAPLVEERTLWLWFSAVMLLALFFTEKPRTHVYTFFMPWLLIAGQVLALGWLWLRRAHRLQAGRGAGRGGRGRRDPAFRQLRLALLRQPRRSDAQLRRAAAGGLLGRL